MDSKIFFGSTKCKNLSFSSKTSLISNNTRDKPQYRVINNSSLYIKTAPLYNNIADNDRGKLLKILGAFHQSTENPNDKDNSKLKNL